MQFHRVLVLVVQFVDFVVRGVDEGNIGGQVDSQDMEGVGLVARKFVDHALIGHVVVDDALQKVIQPAVAFRFFLEHALPFIDLGVKDSAPLEEQLVSSFDELELLEFLNEAAGVLFEKLVEHELLGLLLGAELTEVEFPLEIDIRKGVQDLILHVGRDLAGVVYPQNFLDRFLGDVPVDFQELVVKFDDDIPVLQAHDLIRGVDPHGLHA